MPPAHVTPLVTRHRRLPWRLVARAHGTPQRSHHVTGRCRGAAARVAWARRRRHAVAFWTRRGRR
eukprot:6496120-Prymnesium_polylepis.1